MMKIYKFSLILVIICTIIDMRSKIYSNENYAPLLPKNIVNNDNLLNYKIKALSGNSDAMQRILDYYRFEVYNVEDLEFWELIAAENGEEYSAYSYSFFCYFEKKITIRGIFWLMKDGNNISEIEQSCELLEKDIPLDYLNSENSDIEVNDISDYELLKIYALKGNPEAAYKLYFLSKTQGSCDYVLRIGAFFSKTKEWENSKIYWLRIGAQNGSIECMREYSKILKKSSNKLDNIRSEFWEKKSKL